MEVELRSSVKAAGAFNHGASLRAPHTPSEASVQAHNSKFLHGRFFKKKKKHYDIFISFVITGKSAVAEAYVRRSGDLRESVLSLPCRIIRLSGRLSQLLSHLTALVS